VNSRRRKKPKARTMFWRITDCTRKAKDSGHFRPARWKQGRPWLVLEDNLMFCKVCKEATAADATIGHKNSFVSGNAQLKVQCTWYFQSRKKHCERK